MVVAETMAALAVAKGAVSGVKAVIETCKDVSEVAGHIDQMFNARDQVDKKMTKKGNAEWNEYLKGKLKDGEEQEGESISDITAEVIEKKQIEEQIEHMRRMLNRRFGSGTWDEILALREQRIAENKIKRKKARIRRAREKEEMKEFYAKVWMWCWQIPTVAGMLLAMWWTLSVVSKGNLPFLW